jgi:phage-related protein
LRCLEPESSVENRLRDGIHALRVKVRRVNVRVLYFFCFENRFVLTHGIKKKSAKVADSEIKKAIEYRTDYLARKAEEARR